MRTLLVLLVALLGSAAGEATPQRYQLVFGSFHDAAKADAWAAEVSRRLSVTTSVAHFQADGVEWHRVLTEVLSEDRATVVSNRARVLGLEHWRLEAPPESPGQPPPAAEPAPRQATPTVGNNPRPAPIAHASTAGEGVTDVTSDLDIDLGLQTRGYWRSGAQGQSRFQPSVSGSFVYRRSWNEGSSTFTAQPFGRLDAEDGDRTHADLRQFFVTRVGEDWDFHAGVRQVFWGVTEFVHLVDIINQTDLVENIDGEDKLGQPMLNLSLVRGWGVLDFFVMTGFRERTFPGEDGRLRTWLPVDDSDATFESGDERWYVDGAVRWHHVVGPLEFGLHQFHGTNRDPKFRPVERDDGSFVLQPHYSIIDQTGLDTQVILGDWAWKLEAITREDAEDGRFWAATGGFERTLVGVLGTRADLGLVLEYVYDDRGREADVIYDDDLAFGTRWRLNDASESQALLGLAWDVETEEYIVKLEASRWLGDRWAMSVEGRLFGGANAGPVVLPGSDKKTAPLQRDDFLQLELVRYF